MREVVFCSLAVVVIYIPKSRHDVGILDHMSQVFPTISLFIV